MPHFNSLTQLEFISKIREVHEDRYDISLVNYSGMRDKIIVICRLHGQFNIQAASFRKGSGCKQCFFDRYTKTQDQFLSEANNLCGDKFNFDKVIYVNSHSKIIISCKQHGDFLITPSQLLSGKGCPNCKNRYSNEEFTLECIKRHGSRFNYSLTKYIDSNTPIELQCIKGHLLKRTPSYHLRTGLDCEICKNTKKFIDNANRIHNSFYDLSLVNFINVRTPIDILCPKHGVFSTLPIYFLKGSRCPDCYIQDRYDRFIEKSLRLYNDQYNYSLVKYINSDIPVKLVCKNGHVFERSPYQHLSTIKACPICSGRRKKTNEQFIVQAREVHGNYYDYSLVDYHNTNTPIIITCPKHGKFSVVPRAHLYNKQGCNFCTKESGELKIVEFLLEYDIFFEKQKRFPGCKLKRGLPFDFYLPSYNTCIEFDGCHHFLPLHGDEQLRLVQERDRIKTQFCRDNHIQLIRINGQHRVYPILNHFIYPISI